MRRYTGIDIGRIVFACLIPVLHIGFQNTVSINIIRQYFSRLGVPFFYAVSGMFLITSIEKDGQVIALNKYVCRVGRMLLIWTVIYSPLIIRFSITSFQSLLFKTPAYLWYLTGLLVASVPFCLVNNRRILYGCAFTLYFVGTLFGDSYRWLLGGGKWYEHIFLTTRNGIFFGLPLMCVGEMTWKKSKSCPMLTISALLLILEITFVGTKANINDDRSMYLFLPLFIYYLIPFIREWNPQTDTRNYRGISSAIYVMQFGIITLGNKAISLLRIEGNLGQWGIWIFVIIIPTAVYLLLKDKRIVRYIF